MSGCLIVRCLIVWCLVARCPVVWLPGNIYYTGLLLNDLKKLQTVQNIALRISFNIKDPLLVTTKELHLKANLLPLYYRRKYLLLTVCYRLVGNKSLKTITGRSTRAGTAPPPYYFSSPQELIEQEAAQFIILRLLSGTLFRLSPTSSTIQTHLRGMSANY